MQGTLYNDSASDTEVFNSSSDQSSNDTYMSVSDDDVPTATQVPTQSGESLATNSAEIQPSKLSSKSGETSSSGVTLATISHERPSTELSTHPGEESPPNLAELLPSQLPLQSEETSSLVVAPTTNSAVLPSAELTSEPGESHSTNYAEISLTEKTSQPSETLTSNPFDLSPLAGNFGENPPTNPAVSLPCELSAQSNVTSTLSSNSVESSPSDLLAQPDRTPSLDPGKSPTTDLAAQQASETLSSMSLELISELSTQASQVCATISTEPPQAEESAQYCETSPPTQKLPGFPSTPDNEYHSESDEDFFKSQDEYQSTSTQSQSTTTLE